MEKVISRFACFQIIILKLGYGHLEKNWSRKDAVFNTALIRDLSWIHVSKIND